jgi:hypothetical protein
MNARKSRAEPAGKEGGMARSAVIRKEDVLDETADFLEEIVAAPDEDSSRHGVPRRRHVSEAHVLSRRGRRGPSPAMPGVLVRDALFGILVGVVLIGGITLGLKMPELVERLLQWLTP